MGNILQELINSDSPINKRSSSVRKRSLIIDSPKKTSQATVKSKKYLRLSKMETSPK